MKLRIAGLMALLLSGVLVAGCVGPPGPRLGKIPLLPVPPVFLPGLPPFHKTVHGHPPPPPPPPRVIVPAVPPRHMHKGKSPYKHKVSPPHKHKPGLPLQPPHKKKKPHLHKKKKTPLIPPPPPPIP